MSTTSIIPIKFCGFTREKDLQHALSLRIAAVGLNFWQGSKRYIPLKQATELLRLVAVNESSTQLWGVFVNASLDEIEAIANELQLDAVQLSGHESESEILAIRCALPSIEIVKAISVSGPETFAAAKQLSGAVSRFLLDANVPGEYGGTGTVADWEVAAKFCEMHPDTILAGGLNPDNAAKAFLCVQPEMLDVASGIESQPGIKSSDKMNAIAAELRTALELD